MHYLGLIHPGDAKKCKTFLAFFVCDFVSVSLYGCKIQSKQAVTFRPSYTDYMEFKYLFC